MTRSSSFTNMFNRLPIYTRPKEPAIGYPVLTESTNTHLTGQIVGLDGRSALDEGHYDIGHKIASFKGLPDIPSLSSMHDDELDNFRPPPPLRINALHSPESPTHSRKPVHRKGNNMNAFHTLQRENISRKPAPAVNPVFSLSAKSSTESMRHRDKPAAVERESAPKSRGFGLGSVVKEKVAARRKQLDLAPPTSIMDPMEAASPVAVVKPPNFVSIDDWLDTREREGLHRRSNTVSTVASQATRYNVPLRLHLRRSTFAPLPAPHELAPSEGVPELPMIPQQFLPAPTVRTPPPPQRLIPTRPPSPPITPSRADHTPRDHIEQLEYEQEQLEVKRANLRRAIWDLEQLLPPNPSTHNPIAREDLNKRLEKLVQQLADVEKGIHETGMKLHRAWRRRDKKMGIEGPTHLWVSRVSGP